LIELPVSEISFEISKILAIHNLEFRPIGLFDLPSLKTLP